MHLGDSIGIAIERAQGKYDLFLRLTTIKAAQTKNLLSCISGNTRIYRPTYCRHRRKRPVLPHRVFAIVDVVGHVRLIVEEITFDEQHAVGSKTVIIAQIEDYSVGIAQHRHCVSRPFFDAVTGPESIELEVSDIAIEYLRFPELEVVAGVLSAEIVNDLLGWRCAWLLIRKYPPNNPHPVSVMADRALVLSEHPCKCGRC